MGDEAQTQEIRQKWIDPAYSTPSFAGRLAARKAFRLGKRKVHHALSRVGVYTRYRNTRKPKKTYQNTYMIYYAGEVVEADVINLSSLSSSNNGYKYILCLMDSASRLLRAECMKRINASTVTEAGEKLLNSFPFSFSRMITDSGKEFVSGTFQSMLHAKNIKHSFVRHKCHRLERAQGSLENYLFRLMAEKNNYAYCKNGFLQLAVDALNNRPHSSLRWLTPTEASWSVNKTVLANIVMDDIFQRAGATPSGWKRKNPKLKVNDIVRISLPKNKFARGYNPSFSNELYYVSKVNSHMPNPTFIVNRLTDRAELLGTYSSDELQLVQGEAITATGELPRMARPALGPQPRLV